MTQSLALRKAAAALTGDRKKLFVTNKQGSLVLQDLAVFRELCAEMLLECEPGDFSVTSNRFQSRVFAIAAELKENEFMASEVALALHEVYRITFEKYLLEREKEIRELEKQGGPHPTEDTESGEALSEADAAGKPGAHLRLATGG